jgi:hypothetical protein
MTRAIDRRAARVSFKQNGPRCFAHRARLSASRATGRYDTVSEVKLQLTREGYRDRQIEGRLLLKQITDAIKQARHLK